ncbi:MAG: winged helix-turn-helix domain-containing protein [Prolixibacteraceae bacterium]|nr:winged helix-turn-helix domain-containing protein [Prolixibacteraceae bacterium]MDD2307903.1 winged helix-turn-helix domain-containing protein [Prolixibacteraceae bacterium]
MKKNEIGLNAGKIWQIIDKSGELTINEIKKITELNDLEIALSLGWLSREDKVYFTELEDTMYIGTIDN